jgi:hypothetical protein
MRRAILALLIVMASGLAGCASVPMASMDADAQAKQFSPPKGQSNIYLYRNETFGGAVALTVSLNGRVMGKTGPQTYFLWEVPPGKHEIVSHAENTARLVIEAQEGRSYYIWQEVKMGLWQPRSQLHEVNEQEGKKGVLECKRAILGD